MALTAARTGAHTYTVESESDVMKVYTVSLEFKSCSCPHHQHRKAWCKHLTAATAVCELETAVKLKRISDNRIADLYFRYEVSRPEIAAVILREIEYRQAQLEREVTAKAVFA